MSTTKGTGVDVGFGAKVGVGSGVEVGGGVVGAEEQAIPNANNAAARASIALLRRICIQVIGSSSTPSSYLPIIVTFHPIHQMSLTQACAGHGHGPELYWRKNFSPTFTG